MLPRKYSYHYSRNFKIAVIVSLTAMIILFKLMPRVTIPDNINSDKNEINFLSEIPATFQDESSRSSLPPKPKEPSVVVVGEMNDSPSLPDVEISASSNNIGNTQSALENGNGTGSNTHFVPRQILEVVPVKPDKEVSGTIRLSLKIGTDGKVAGYKVIFNSTDCPECLKNVITAAMKSKWQPALRKGQKVEYWIEKSYAFN